MARQTTVKALPRTVSVVRGRDEERRIEGERRRQDKGNQHHNPPQTTIVVGGRDKRVKTKHEMERRHNPQSHEEGKVPS